MCSFISSSDLINNRRLGGGRRASVLSNSYSSIMKYAPPPGVKREKGASTKLALQVLYCPPAPDSRDHRRVPDGLCETLSHRGAGPKVTKGTI